MINTDLPKSDKMLQRSASNKHAVKKSVSQEQHEKLVIMEAHAVVHPWTMMVHFQDTSSAHAAVVGPVWFY